jgi:hypothetical protein
MPSFPQTESDEDTMTYAAVGRALSQWEMLEWTIGTVFVELIRTNWIGAERAFGAVQSSATRMDAMKAAANAHFTFEPNKELHDQFNALAAETGSLSSKRTHVAHGVVAHYRDGVFLGPAWYSTKHNKLKEAPSFRYSAEQINQFARDFQSLRMKWAQWREDFAETLRTSQQTRL